MITRTFKLCLNAGTGSAPYINVSQYDEGETWLFELYSETGERYIPSTGAIVGVKSDGHGIINTGTVDNEGRVVITETEQMTASAGRAIFELSIDGLTHGTANFIVAVERKPTDEAVMSDSDMSLIQEAVDSAAVIVEVIGDSDPSEVIGEHVDDWLDNHPEATTTVQDGAITAPKLNNSLWDKLLVSEEASGAVASFDDGADDVPVSSLKVNLEPVQLGSGDPSPSNIRPIVAANGKNLMDVADRTVSSTSATVNTIYAEACTAVVNGDKVTGTVNGNWSKLQFALDTSTLTDGVTYTWSVYFDNPSGGTVAVSYYDTTWRGTVTSTATKVKLQTTFTYSSANPVVRVAAVINNTGTNTGYVITVSEMQLERGSFASAYQPYQGIMVERCGINQWDEEWEVGYYGSTGQPNNTSGYIRSKNFIPVMPNATYYCHTGTASTFCLQFYGNDTAFLSQDYNHRDTTVTIPNDCYYVRFWRNENAYNNDISINYPSTITDYHAYVGTSYPYSLGQSVYGGTVDLATGVLTVDRGYVDLGTLTWLRSSYYNVYYAHVDGKAIGRTNMIMSSYKVVDLVYSMLSDGEASGTQSSDEINVKDDRVTTVSDFVTAVTGQTICYELATPTTIQLTPTQVNTLLGYNNISSSGTVEVVYHADTKLYVDKMTNVDNAIIAPTEADFVATRNYTVNDLLIVADTLYKVTANIATGSAITPNSNVQQTTLSALIKALS